jgi:enoyl-CoA hydratase
MSDFFDWLDRLLDHPNAPDWAARSAIVIALAMGLVNRTVPSGQALVAAVALGKELAALPQAALRGDRLSAYGGDGLNLEAALRQEFTRGASALGEAFAGATRFAAR